MEQPSVPFPELPEIIENVVKHLKSDELWSLRLISRQWNVEILSLFDKRKSIVNWSESVYLGPDAYSKRKPNSLMSFLDLAVKIHPILLKRAVIIAEEIHDVEPCLKKYGYFIELLSITDPHPTTTTRLFENEGCKEPNPNAPPSCGCYMDDHIARIVTTHCPNLTTIELLFNHSWLKWGSDKFTDYNLFKDVPTKLKRIEFYGETGCSNLGLNLIKASPLLETLLFPEYMEIPKRPNSWRRLHPKDPILSYLKAITFNGHNLKSFLFDAAYHYRLDMYNNFLECLCGWDFNRLERLYLGDLHRNNDKYGVRLYTLLRNVKDTLVVLGLNGVGGLRHGWYLNGHTGVKHFDFKYDDEDDYDYMRPFKITQMPKLPFLRKLSIRCCEISWNEFNLYHFVRDLPLLEELDMNNYAFTVAQYYYFDPKDSLITCPHHALRRLSIQHIVCTRLELDGVFNSFPNITELSFSPSTMWDFEVNGVKPESITLSEAGQGMKHLTKLRRLEIVCHSLSYEKDEWIKTFETMSALGLEFLYIMAINHSTNTFNQSLEKAWPEILNLSWKTTKLCFYPDVLNAPSNNWVQDIKLIRKSARNQLRSDEEDDRVRGGSFFKWVTVYDYSFCSK